nr:MAG TPA: Z DNA-binding protein [Bacteriophage sp.]
MRLFTRSKKVTSNDTAVDSLQLNVQRYNSLGEPLDKLVNDDLPWGWIHANKDFTDPIKTEYTYFLNTWLDSRSKSPRDEYNAISSFVHYMYSLNQLCASKGECFEFWCNNILFTADYYKKMKDRMSYLSDNLIQLENDYNKRQLYLQNLPQDVYQFLSEHNGISQTDIYKAFEPILKNDIQELLYHWDKSGTIKRKKNGKTYNVFIVK